MRPRFLLAVGWFCLLGLLPLTARAQSNDVRTLVDSVRVEAAMLYGNLEISTGPNIEQMRTRLRTARDYIQRIVVLVAAPGLEGQAIAELDGMDRELLVLQGMLEGSYVSGRDFMLAHLRSVQAYSTSARSLLGTGAPAQPVVQHPPIVEDMDAHGHGHHPPDQPPAQPQAPMAMDQTSFMSLLAAVDAQAFSDGKLAVIRQAVSAGNYFSTAQVGQLVQAMAFGDDKIEVVVTTYPLLIDPQNLFSVYGYFDFDSDIEELQQRLGIH